MPKLAHLGSGCLSPPPEVDWFEAMVILQFTPSSTAEAMKGSAEETLSDEQQMGDFQDSTDGLTVTLRNSASQIYHNGVSASHTACSLHRSFLPGLRSDSPWHREKPEPGLEGHLVQPLRFAQRRTEAFGSLVWSVSKTETVEAWIEKKALT